MSNDQVTIVVAGVSGVFCVLFITAVCLLVPGGNHAPRRVRPRAGTALAIAGATLARLRAFTERARSRARTSRLPATVEPFLYWAATGGRHLGSPAARTTQPSAGDVPGRAAHAPPGAARTAHPAGDPITHDLWDGHPDVHAFPADEEVA